MADMASTEWWQRGPVEGVPDILQPVAHILLQVRESVGEMVLPLTEEQWNARPGSASPAFHVRAWPASSTVCSPTRENRSA
jgi:hypothetical protein